MAARSLLSVWLLIFFTSLSWAESFSGKVVGVTDGDTISVMRDGKAVKVRLHGIDCPESHQAFGAVAKQFTSKACFGQVVTVEVKDIDRYGRTVGEVVLSDGKVLNHEIVRNGCAWWYEQYAKGDTTLQGLEKAAREGKRGLWSDPNPIPPWDFRRGKISDDRGSVVIQPGVQVGSPTTVPEEAPVYEAPNTRQTAPVISNRGPPPADSTVYATNTGIKYHAAGCRYLSKSSVAISLADAAGRGLTPCSVCSPPTSSTSSPPGAYQSAPEFRVTAPSSIAASGASTAEDSTVYVTKTGSKYHRAGCKYLSKSQITMSLSQARNSYGPCSVCGPPR